MTGSSRRRLRSRPGFKQNAPYPECGSQKILGKPGGSVMLGLSNPVFRDHSASPAGSG